MSLKKDIIEAEVKLGSNEAQAGLTKLSAETASLTNENDRLRISQAKLKALGKQNTEEYKQLTKQIKENNTTIRSNKGQMDALRKTLGLTNMTSSQLRKRVSELRRELQGMTEATNPAQWRKLNNELKATQAQYQKVQGSIGKTRGVMSKLNSVAGGLLPALGAAAIIGAIGRITKGLFDLTKTMQGEALRANVVLGNQMEYVAGQADLLAEKMGATNHEFINMVTNTADLLIPLDFTRKQAATMATEVQGLAGALDEWTAGKLGVAEVSNILTKAMLGENEQLKQLGIAIRKDTDEYRDLVKQKIETEGVTKQQAEAMATLTLLYKKSGDAQAAYLREGNALLRWQKSVSLWWKNMKESAANYFIDDHIDKLQKEKAELNLLVGAVTNAANSQETRNRLIDELQSKYPNFLKNLDTEKLTNEQLRDRLKEVNEEYENKILLAIREDSMKSNYQDRLDLKLDELEAIKDIARNEGRLAELREEQNNEAPGSARYNELAKSIALVESNITGYTNSLEKNRSKVAELVTQENELNAAIEDLKKKTGGSSTPEDEGGSSPGSGSTDDFDMSILNPAEDGEIDMGWITAEIQADAERFAAKKRSEEEWTEFLNEQIEEQTAAHLRGLEAEEQIAQARAELKDIQINAIGQLASALSGMFETGSAAQIAMMAIEKAIAIAQIWINLAKEKSLINVAAAQMATIPVIGPGLAASYSAAMTAKALTAAKINTGLIVAQSVGQAVGGKKNKGKKDGGFTDSAATDDQVVDYVHSNEFVASAPAVRNPTIRPVLDIIDMAQRNGTIAQLNLPAVLGAIGRRSGGYAEPTPATASQANPPQPYTPSDPAFNRLLADNLKATKRMTDAAEKLWKDGTYTRLLGRDGLIKQEAEYQKMKSNVTL